jgi:DNA-binding LytR/AlgR family response regulator
MATAPLNTKQPVKLFVYKISYLHVDGSSIDTVTTTAQRSEVQNILDRLAAVLTPVSGQQLLQVTIDIGNGQDTA